MTDRPAIKPLVWGKTSYGTPEVNTVVGVYRLNRAGNGGWSASIKNELLRDSDGRTNFATLEAAKAAAQSDFASRIRSCLLDKPEAVEGEPVAWRWRFDETGPWSYGDIAPAKLRFLGEPPEIVEPLYTRPADTDAAQSEIDRLRRELEEARKALAPFAEEAACYDPDDGDGDSVVWATPVYFKIRDLRRARAALRAGEEGR